MPSQLDADQVEQAVTEYADADVLTREDIDEILRDYGAFIGAGELALDEKGAATLEVDEEIEVLLVHLPQFPGIVAAVEFDGEIRQNPQLLKKLLQANMSWELTHGGCFAVIPPAKELVLCRLIGLVDRDLERIDNELGAFVDLARGWQEVLEFDLLLDDADDALLAPEFQRGMMRA